MADATPHTPSQSTRRIPHFLRATPRWLLWDWKPHPVDGTATKAPRGSVLSPSIAQPFEAVSEHERIGFCFTGGVWMAGRLVTSLDVDGCRDPQTGALEDWARGVWDHYGRPFTEITPSGTGLRIWLTLANPPKAFPKIRVPFDAPAGVDKTPEIQVFGLGSAQYVTVTGDHLPGSSMEPGEADDLTWLADTFHVDTDRVSADAQLPEGVGAAPGQKAIRSSVESAPNGAALIAGDWASLGLPSASEAWWRLTRHALAAAENHGAAAVDFLMGCPAWASGLVDSREPDRYMRRDWVTADIARVGSKTDVRLAAELFADDFDADAWQPPFRLHGADLSDPDAPWIMPGGEYVGRARRPLKWIVHGFLTQGAIAQFYGAPSCGKTPFALSLSLAVACGQPTWFGFDVDGPGPVVYMVGEGGPGLANRIAGQIEQMGLSYDEFAASPFYVTTRPGQLSSAENCGEWVQRIREVLGAPDGDTRRLRMLVVDTQNMNFGEGDENSTQDMTRFLVNLKRMSALLGCTIVTVHHVGHGDQDRARGNRAQEGALDLTLQIKKTGRLAQAISHKTKDWEAPEALQGTLQPLTLGVDEKGRDITTITLVEGEPDLAAVFEGAEGDELRAVVEQVHHTDGAHMSQVELAGKVGVTRKRLRGLLAKVIELGYVAKRETGQGCRKPTYLVTDKGLTLGPFGEGPNDDFDVLRALS